MNLIKPCLTVTENNKLYLSRRPGFIVWFLLGLTISLFIEVSLWFISNIFFFITLLLGVIIFGLDIVGNWESIILDRNQNIAIVAKYVWSEKLLFNNSEKPVIINLNDICYIGISQHMGLFFLNKNGMTVTFNVNGLSRDETQNIKRKITFFLNISRIKSAEPFALHLHENLVATSEYENEELHFGQCMKFKEPQLSRSNDHLQIPMYKRLSTPVFGSQKIYQQFLKYDLKRRPCIHNFNHCRYLSYIKHRSSVPKKVNVEKMHLKIHKLL